MPGGDATNNSSTRAQAADAAAGLSFAENLRAWRSQRGLSQRELAQASGISLRALRDLESGRVIQPRPSTVRLLLTALDRQTPAPSEPGSLSTSAHPAAVPAELPLECRPWVGRGAEANALDEAAAGGVVLVTGSPGVGKTALAVHWGHLAKERFPDGQLYADMRGYALDSPRAAGDVLGAFLRALGTPPNQIPPSEPDRAAMYRTIAAERRLLILLDNAADVRQVRPLLPGNRRSVVVVTSRDAMPGLVSRDGAVRVLIQPLGAEEAVTLLKQLLGDALKTAADADELARLCARIPLALRVAAESLRTVEGATVAALTSALNGRDRLERLNAGNDPDTDVRSVFSWSYRALDHLTARAFRLLALQPAPSCDPAALGALLDRPLPVAESAARHLVRAHLVDEREPGRLGLHDLLRSYARSLDGTSADETAALTRLRDHQLASLSRAIRLLYPAEHQRQGFRADTDLAMADPAEARAWLDAEQDCWSSHARRAIQDGADDYVVSLSDLLFRHLDLVNDYDAGMALHTIAYQAAEQAGDMAAQARVASRIGLVHQRRSDYAASMTEYRRAARLAAAAADHMAELSAVGNLGTIYWRTGDLPAAERTLRRAAALAAGIGDWSAHARTAGNLGLLLADQGAHAAARDQLEIAFSLFSEHGDVQASTNARAILADLDARSGHLERAIKTYREVLDVFHALGDGSGAATTRASLGQALGRIGSVTQARQEIADAVSSFRHLGDRDSLADALCCLGELELSDHEALRAWSTFNEAHQIYSEIRSRSGQGRAARGMAQALTALGATERAAIHWRTAIEVFDALGSPEAATAREELAALTAGRSM